MARTRYLVLHNGKKGLIIDTLKLRLGKLRDRVFCWARVVQAGRLQGSKMAMYTLTYDVKGTKVPAAAWAPNHIRDFLKSLRKRMGSRLLAYAWVAELHVSGQIHYHIIVVYRGYLPYPDKSYKWIDRTRFHSRLWPWGMSRTDIKVRSPYYICTYVGKEYQKDFENFPKGAHGWSVWVSDLAMREAIRYNSLDRLARELVKLYGWDMGLYEYKDLRSAWKSENGWGYVGSYLTLSLAQLMAGTDDG